MACHEREIVFLNKCKERLTSVLPNPVDCEPDMKKYLQKVNEYERILEQKDKEFQEVSSKVRLLEGESQRKVEEEKAKGRIEILRLGLELKIREQEKKQLKEAIQKMDTDMQGFEEVGGKIINIEYTQNQLIAENHRLKSLLPIEEKVNFEKYLQDKALASKLSQTSNEMIVIDTYARNITKILEAVMKGKEPPVEAMKLFLSLKKGKRNTELDTGRHILSKDIRLNELAKKNFETVGMVHRNLMKHMDEICEQYARIYGNHCNLQ